MTRLINRRSLAQHAAWTRWHQVVAILLALLLLLLWATGRGPNFAPTADHCCGKRKAIAILPPASVPPPP